jgi:ribosomal-protein-alanine N-acetyltransferase
MIRLNIPERVETQRLVLQRLRYEDAEEIFYSYATKPEATRYLSWKTHESIEDTRAFLRYAVEGWTWGTDYSFSIRMKGTNLFIGSFGVINDKGKLQFGYVISPSRWGQGFATEAVKAMMDILRELDNVFRIGTFVDAENIASQKVLRRAGLVPEAILVRWYRFVNQDNRPKDCILFRLPGKEET